MANIISQAEAFEKLRLLNALLYESLETSILFAIEHFENSKHRYDAQFFASHVRSKLREVLEPEAEKYRFSIVEVGPNSFFIIYQPFTIRILKALMGVLPPPGDSFAKLTYYNANNLPFQTVLPGLESFYTPPLPTTINLIAYYDLNPSHELAFLRIACPRYATTTQVVCFWDKEVKNPLLSESIQLDQAPKKVREDVAFTLREITI